MYFSRRAPHTSISDVTVSYRCPRCGQPHPVVECGVLALEESEADRPVDLQQLAGQLRREIVLAVMAGEAGEAQQFATVLAGVTSRLARIGGEPAPVTLERRLRNAASKSPSGFRRGNG